MSIGKEISKQDIVDRLSKLSLSDYSVVTIIKHLENPPVEPNMKKLAPIMNALFPEITKMIKNAFVNEADVTEWTREANEILIKNSVQDQVRRDIIQGSITYYLINETNNRTSLENWIEKGGLR